MRLKVVDLPAPLGPSRPTISPAFDVEAHVIDGHQAPKDLYAPDDLQQGLAWLGLVALGQKRRRPPSRACAGQWRAPGQPGLQVWATALGACLSSSTTMAPSTGSSAVARADERGSQTWISSSSSFDDGGAREGPHTLPTPPSTAMKRYSMPLPSEKGEGLMAR